MRLRLAGGFGRPQGAHDGTADTRRQRLSGSRHWDLVLAPIRAMFRRAANSSYEWADAVIDGGATRISVVVCALALACAGGVRAPTGAVSALPAPPRVPAVPPDTVPSDRYAAERLDPSRRFPRDLVVIGFRPGATLAEKEAALDLVQGAVVGGWPLPPGMGEGLYLVRIREDGTMGPLTRAIAQLRVLPQVALVGPDLVPRPRRLPSST